MGPHPTPSAHARELVRGAYDLHVHVDPDVATRLIDDVSLARRFAELGLAGFQLKSHYTSTAERARSVSAAVEGVRVLGALVLNQSVGGLNALAVELAAREGARTVWMPTVHAANELHRVHSFPPGAPVPVWLKLEASLRSVGLAAQAVPVIDADGELLPQTRTVLEVAARHQLVLATGHLSRDEIFAVVDGALAAGIADVVVTHPDFPSQALSLEDQGALARKGALLERCFTTPYTGKASWKHVFEGVRVTGAQHNVLSSDLGQVFNPPVEDGLALFADQLLGAGFREQDVRTMAVKNTRRLAGEES